MKNLQKEEENVEEGIKTSPVTLYQGSSETCPECGNSTLIHAGRCSTCGSCGWSKCSM